MPFTKKFFTYTPPKDADDAAHLHMLYKNEAPIYFQDWLEKNPEIKTRYTTEKTITPGEIEAFKHSDEYEKSWAQMQTVICAIQDWATHNEIKHAANWATVLEKLPNEQYVDYGDIPKWFSVNKKTGEEDKKALEENQEEDKKIKEELSGGKKALEDIYLLIEYSDTISLHQKKNVISQLSLPIGSSCSPGGAIQG